MYNLVNLEQNTLLDQAYELVDLFKKLDHYTQKGMKVVITDDKGEVKAGNMLAWDYRGKFLNGIEHGGLLT